MLSSAIVSDCIAITLRLLMFGAMCSEISKGIPVALLTSCIRWFGIFATSFLEKEFIII